MSFADNEDRAEDDENTQNRRQPVRRSGRSNTFKKSMREGPLRVQRKLNWSEQYAELKEYKAKHGNCKVRRDHPVLGYWVNNQRTKRGELSPERVALLDDIGFVWNMQDKRWEEQLAELANFKKQHVGQLWEAARTL